MGKNKVVQTFFGDGSWVCPAGVTRVKVSAQSLLFSQISGYSTTAVAVSSDNDAYAWGANTYGQIGDGTVTSKSVPTLVLGGFKWRSAAAGGDNTAGITIAGDGYTWGANGRGALGNGDNTPRSSPVIISGGLKWRKIVCGGQNFMLGITTTGALYAWGDNSWGTLGQGDKVSRSTPTLIAGGPSSWGDVSAGNTHVLAISSDGVGYAWGVNVYGCLGDGTIVAKSTPTLIAGGFTWKALSAGSVTSHGITKTGKAFAWGQNADGQLGTGDVSPRSSPVAVLGGLNFHQISSGVQVLAVADTGTLYAWGDNDNGQLGTGDVTPRSSPVAVLGSLSPQFIFMGPSTGNISGPYVIADRVLYAWGIGTAGRLGDNSVTAKSSPVLVSGSLNYMGTQRVQLNTVEVAVTPGSTYPVKVYGLLTRFGDVALYQDPYLNGAVPTQITLEYEA